MESIEIAKKILQDSTGYYRKMLWNPYQEQTISYDILGDTRRKCYGIHINSKQDPSRSYKILPDTIKKYYGIHINSEQDSTRSYKMLRDTRQNAMESISIANKILQDPSRFYWILKENAMESISIANKILEDSRG